MNAVTRVRTARYRNLRLSDASAREMEGVKRFVIHHMRERLRGRVLVPGSASGTPVSNLARCMPYDLQNLAPKCLERGMLSCVYVDAGSLPDEDVCVHVPGTAWEDAVVRTFVLKELVRQMDDEAMAVAPLPVFAAYAAALRLSYPDRRVMTIAMPRTLQSIAEWAIERYGDDVAELFEMLNFSTEDFYGWLRLGPLPADPAVMRQRPRAAPVPRAPIVLRHLRTVRQRPAAEEPARWRNPATVFPPLAVPTARARPSPPRAPIAAHARIVARAQAAPRAPPPVRAPIVAPAPVARPAPWRPPPRVEGVVNRNLRYMESSAADDCPICQEPFDFGARRPIKLRCRREQSTCGDRDHPYIDVGVKVTDRWMEACNRIKMIRDLEDVAAGTPMILPCGHTMHSECLSGLMNTPLNKCPMCSQPKEPIALCSPIANYTMSPESRLRADAALAAARAYEMDLHSGGGPGARPGLSAALLATTVAMALLGSFLGAH